MKQSAVIHRLHSCNLKNNCETTVPTEFQTSGCMTTPVGTGMQASCVFWMSSTSVLRSFSASDPEMF